MLQKGSEAKLVKLYRCVHSKQGQQLKTPRRKWVFTPPFLFLPPYFVNNILLVEETDKYVATVNKPIHKTKKKLQIR